MRVAFRAHGRVQGVGFRAFVLEEAMAHGLTGWVRNEPDRAVSGEADGDPDLLERFRRALEQGNGASYLTHLEWSPLPEGRPLPNPFEIRF